MIAEHQPTLFSGALTVRLSSAVDGSMLDRAAGFHAPEAIANRQRFCEANGFSYADTVYQAIQYGDHETYDLVRVVGAEETTRYQADVHADALITRQAQVGLFLPVADCVATVVYAPATRVLASLHLGRHSTLSELIPNTLHALQDLGCAPNELQVWMSPHAAQQSYRLEWFDAASAPEWTPFVERKDDGIYVDLAGFNKQRFVAHGVSEANIEVSTIDTMQSRDYFSHANGEHGGRMAVLAYMY